MREEGSLKAPVQEKQHQALICPKRVNVASRALDGITWVSKSKYIERACGILDCENEDRRNRRSLQRTNAATRATALAIQETTPPFG